MPQPSALEFPFASLPESGRTLAVAQGIEWIRMKLPFALDHINLWLLDDGEGCFTTVDTGFTMDETRAAWQSILTERRLQRSVVTHGHPDHLGSAAWLEREFGAQLWITHGEYAWAQLVIEQVGAYATENMIRFFESHGLDAGRLDGLIKRGNSFKVGVPDLPMTYRRMFDGDVLRMGGQDWRVIVGHGHAAEHASLYCRALGVLISGDMLLPRISTNVPVLSMCPFDDPLSRFLASLDKFLELPADTLVLPSHGRPFRGIHERVRQLHEHHDSRCALLLANCTTPKTAADLIPVIFERDIPDPHQVMFAMGEAIAHLNLLETQGRLVRQVECGITRYVTH